MPRACASVSGLRTDNAEKWGNPDGCMFWKTWWCNAHDDMTRCNTQTNDMATTANNWRTPSTSVLGRYNTPPLREDLVPRSRMAPEGQRKRKRRGKLSCFFDKRVRPKNLEKVKPYREKNKTEINEVESTPVGKRNKELQIRTALRMKKDERLDKTKRTWAKRHNTPVKQDREGIRVI